jgi:hypothetical protein
MSSSNLQSWRIAAVVALGVIVLSIPLYVARESQRDDHPEAAPAEAEFVGREQCIACHTEAYELWRGSDHDNAMDFATDETVLGDFDDAEFAHGGITSRFSRKDDGFFVFTEGPDGEMAEFKIEYTFGIEPLQQYLVPFPGGRLQALPIAWDTERDRWFTLNPSTTIAPDDWLHWTRNGQNWNGMCARHVRRMPLDQPAEELRCRDQHLRYHLVRNRCELRGLSRTRFSPRCLGRGGSDGQGADRQLRPGRCEQRVGQSAVRGDVRALSLAAKRASRLRSQPERPAAVSRSLVA